MLRSTLLMFIALSVLTGCDKNSKSSGQPDVMAYKSDGVYADVLSSCALAEGQSDSCTIATLPPIAMVTPFPSVDDIMERVVVSDEWMGARLEQVLQQYPQDVLNLFGAVTAVVMHRDIRPSFYTGTTGAIYLDPGYLWLDPQERGTVSKEEDYRIAFADPMKFRFFTQDIINNQPAYPHFYVDPEENISRTLNDIVLPLASLLIHELSHANDIFSPHNYADVSMSDTVLEATSKLQDKFPSTLLTQEYPLLSQLAMHMADILYVGEAPSADDVEVTGAEVGAEFEVDGASDLYGYRSKYEDLAMLFEMTMMKLHFDVDTDSTFLSVPEDGECSGYLIEWGVRGRIGEQQVRVRAERTIQLLLPESDYSAELSALAAPSELPLGVSWCDYLALMNSAQAKPGSSALQQASHARSPQNHRSRLPFVIDRGVFN